MRTHVCEMSGDERRFTVINEEKYFLSDLAPSEILQLSNDDDNSWVI